MTQMNARVTVTRKGEPPETMRVGHAEVIPDPNQTALQRILELGEGDYVVTINAARNVVRFVKLPAGVSAGDLLGAISAVRIEDKQPAPDGDEQRSKRRK